jgi:hypothetical protein
MGKLNARSHLGDLRRGARRRIIRYLVAADGPLAGRTTGTVNPGAIWVSRYLQVGVEAIVPIDPHSGPDLGFRAQAHRTVGRSFPIGTVSRSSLTERT